MASFGRIRLIAAIAGSINLALLLFVFAVPFWRTSLINANVNALNSMRGYEGLWTECFTFYEDNTQCTPIGSMSERNDASYGEAGTTYYQYGVYAHLTAYRIFIVIAFLAEIAAVCLSCAGMECTKVFDEGGRVKRLLNISAGICHFGAGVLTGISVSWYAAEVVREYWSPFYQTTRIKYTLGACLYIGWISMVTSIVLGSLLTCCTCYNQPLDTTDYDWKPPISEIEIPPQPVESVRMGTEVGTYYDQSEWDDDAGRYTSKKTNRSPQSHRSHRSHKSHKSHRSHRSHKSQYSHRTTKESGWVDDYQHDSTYRRDYEPEKDDGFV